MDILRFSKALFFRMKSLPENGLSHSHNDRHPVRHKALHLRFDETISQRPQGRRAMASWGSKIGHSVVDQNMKYCRLQPVKWSNYQFVKWNYVLYPEGSHCELAGVKWPTVTTDHYHQQVRHATFGEATLQYNYIYQYIHQKTSLGPKNQEHANFHRQFHGETTCVFLAKKHWHFPVLQRQCLASQQVAWWANGFIANPCEHRRTIFCGNPAKQFFAIIYIDLALFNCDLTFLSFGNLR